VFRDVGEADAGRRIGRRRRDKRPHRLADCGGERGDRVVGPGGEDDAREVGPAGDGAAAAELADASGDPGADE
jgi:hypothetical protein